MWHAGPADVSGNPAFERRERLICGCLSCVVKGETAVTVSLDICLPQDEWEEQFHVPVCGEWTYKNVIRPVAEKWSLDLFMGWGEIREIEPDHVELFFKQVDIFIENFMSIPKNHELSREKFIERMKFVCKSIREAVARRPDVVFFIG